MKLYIEENEKLLRVYKDDKQYPRKVIDDDGELYFYALDDDMIEIECDFHRMKKHLEDSIDIDVRYNINVEEVSFIELKSILFLFLEVRKNQRYLIANIELLDKVRDDKWGLSDFLEELKKQLKYFKDIKINYYEFGEDAFIWLEEPLYPSYSLEKNITVFAKNVNELLESVKIGLGKILLEERHFASEKLFCEEILTPLFRHMGFEGVIFNHGSKEFGKDYILTEMTKINTFRYYGVQVKAGNIDGGVNSQIDNIISQIRDAFEIPFVFKNENKQSYISELYIIISGRFTSNAKEKIRYKISKGIYGAVHFLDKEDIENLIVKYWRA